MALGLNLGTGGFGWTMIGSLLSMAKQNKRAGKAEREYRDITNQMLGVQGGRSVDTGTVYDESRRLFDSLQGSSRESADRTLAQREALGKNLLTSYDSTGTAAKADIARSYDAAGNRAMNDLRSRGFAGSSAASGVHAGIARQKGEALARKTEELGRGRLALEGGVGESNIAAAEARDRGALGMGLQEIDLLRGLESDRMGIQRGLLPMVPNRANPYDAILQGMNYQSSRQAMEAAEPKWYESLLGIGGGAFAGSLGAGIGTMEARSAASLFGY